MAIKHLAAPLLAGGAVLGYAAWARFKRARQLSVDHSPQVNSPSVDSILDEWASNSSPPDDSMSSTTLSHGLDEAISSSTVNHGLGSEGVSSGVVAGTGLPDADDASPNRISGSWSDEEVAGLSSSSMSDFSSLDPSERIGSSDSNERLDSSERVDGVASSASAITATRAEPRPESSPIVDFSAQANEEQEENEQYESEGPMAPEDLGVRWLARATEALSPYNAQARREVQEDWVEAGLVAEASVRAADGGDLVLDEDIEVLSEDGEPLSRRSEYELTRP